MSNNWLNQNGNYFIYVGDAMCSWCYGFSPALTKLKEAFPEIELHMVNGGLRPFGTEKITEMKDFLAHHWEQVTERSGQVFSYEILDEEDFLIDTEPASRATVVVRSMKPDVEFDFFKDIQLAFYRDNQRTDRIETYLELCDKYDIDREEFRRLFESDEMKYETKQDFQLSQQLGIKGFPSMVYKQKDQYYLISNGYREADELIDIVRKIQEEND